MLKRRKDCCYEAAIGCESPCGNDKGPHKLALPSSYMRRGCRKGK